MRLALTFFSLCLAIGCAGALETAVVGSRSDAGGDWHRDAGPGWTGDGGAPEPDGGSEPARCSAQPVLVRTFGRALAGLAATSDRIAIAYRTDAGTAGLQLLAGDGSAIADSPIAPQVSGADFVPVDLSAGGGDWFLAGTMTFPGGATAAASVFVDASGSPGAITSAASYSSAVAGARTGAGGLLLALGGGAASHTMSALAVDAAGHLGAGSPIGEVGFGGDRWGLAWSSSPESGAACGTLVRDGQRTLALFEADASRALIARATAIPLGTEVNPQAFACRIALAGAYRAIGWASGSTGARLAWVDSDGALLAGPAPFLATAGDASGFDVAANGAATAVAYIDSAGGVPRVLLRIYPSPGEQPSEVRVDSDLALGAFSAGRVRVVPFGGGFLVGFGADTPEGRVLVARAVGCEP